MEDHKPSAPLRLFLRTVLNVMLVAIMAKYLPQFFTVTGGLGAYVVIGALLTLMNVLIRPVLALITLPLKLFATLFAVILVNGLFIWLTWFIAQHMDPTLVTLAIGGGVAGWIIVTFLIGTANWLMKLLLK